MIRRDQKIPWPKYFGRRQLRQDALDFVLSLIGYIYRQTIQNILVDSVEFYYIACYTSHSETME
jgi:hypothetical protein